MLCFHRDLASYEIKIIALDESQLGSVTFSILRRADRQVDTANQVGVDHAAIGPSLGASPLVLLAGLIEFGGPVLVQVDAMLPSKSRSDCSSGSRFFPA